jgi:hypothetical protein
LRISATSAAPFIGLPSVCNGFVSMATAIRSAFDA